MRINFIFVVPFPSSLGVNKGNFLKFPFCQYGRIGVEQPSEGINVFLLAYSFIRFNIDNKEHEHFFSPYSN